LPNVEYATNMEYRSTRERNCDNTVMSRCQVDAWMKLPSNPVQLCSFVLLVDNVIFNKQET